MRLTRTFLVMLAAVAALPIGCKKDQAQSATPTVSDAASKEKPPSTGAASSEKASSPKETIERTNAAIEKLEKAFNSLDSIKMEFETNASTVHGREGSTRGAGIFSILRTPEATLRRVHINNFHVVQKDRDKQMVIEERLLWFTDGETLTHWAAVQTGTETVRAKYRHVDMLQVGGPELFEIIRSDYVLTLASEDTLDGKPVVIFDAKPKSGKGRTRHWFDAETGVRIRNTEWDASGDIYFQLKMVKLETGVEFEDDWFNPKLPKDTQKDEPKKSD